MKYIFFRLSSLTTNYKLTGIGQCLIKIKSITYSCFLGQNFLPVFKLCTIFKIVLKLEIFPVQNRQKNTYTESYCKAKKFFVGPTDFFEEAKRIVNFAEHMNSSVRIMKRKGEWINIKKKETRMGEERRDREFRIGGCKNDW